MASAPNTHTHQALRASTQATRPLQARCGPYSLWVGEGPQAVVVLLPGGVPQPQVDGLPIHHHIRRIVVETAETERSASAWALSLHRPGALSAPCCTPGAQTRATWAPPQSPEELPAQAPTPSAPHLWTHPACSHCGDVLSREGVGCVADQQAGLPHGAVERGRAHVAPRSTSAHRSARAPPSHGPRVGTGVPALQIRSERGTGGRPGQVGFGDSGGCGLRQAASAPQAGIGRVAPAEGSAQVRALAPPTRRPGGAAGSWQHQVGLGWRPAPGE